MSLPRGRGADGHAGGDGSGGVQIPALSLGTFQLVGDVARPRVTYALDIGYRHIDTAQIYGNEAEIGEAIERSPRAA